MTDESDETALITACINGDEAAWRQFLEQYGRMIYAIPLQMGFPAAAAEEIYSEICLVLLEKLPTLREHQFLRTWLFTLTKRACIQRLRRKKEIASIDDLEKDPADKDNLEDNVILVEQMEQVHHALDTLDVRCRRLLQAFFFDTVAPSYEEIASELNISLGSVGPTRTRCLEKLRQAIFNLENDKSSQ